MKRLHPGLLLLGALCIAGSAYAHHSATGVDQTRTVTVEGTVKQFKWANPHAWIEMEVPKGGGVEIWNIEMTSPAILVRTGWKATTLKFGDKIKAVARPMKNGDPGGLFVSVTLADGTTLPPPAAGRGGAAPAQPAPPAPAAAPAAPAGR